MGAGMRPVKRWVCDPCRVLVGCDFVRATDGIERRCCVCGVVTPCQGGSYVDSTHSERAHRLLADKLHAERMAKGTISAPEVTS